MTTKVIVRRDIIGKKVVVRVSLEIPNSAGTMGPEIFERTYEFPFEYYPLESDPLYGLPTYNYVVNGRWTYHSAYEMTERIWQIMKDDARSFVQSRLRQAGYRIRYMFFCPYGFGGKQTEIEVFIARK